MSHDTAQEARQAPLEPDRRIVGERECEERTDLSRTTRWRLMQRGLFPAKVRLSPNRTGWRLSDILEWLEAREVA